MSKLNDETKNITGTLSRKGQSLGLGGLNAQATGAAPDNQTTPGHKIPSDLGLDHSRPCAPVL